MTGGSLSAYDTDARHEVSWVKAMRRRLGNFLLGASIAVAVAWIVWYAWRGVGGVAPLTQSASNFFIIIASALFPAGLVVALGVAVRFALVPNAGVLPNPQSLSTTTVVVRAVGCRLHRDLASRSLPRGDGIGHEPRGPWQSYHR